MQPGFMDDLARTAQERYAQMKQGVQAIPGNVAHAVSPVTDRLSMLANDPKQFASTAYDSMRQAVAPVIGRAATPAGVPMNPNVRPGLPDEALPADMQGMSDEERRAAVTRAMMQQYQQ